MAWKQRRNAIMECPEIRDIAVSDQSTSVIKELRCWDNYRESLVKIDFESKP